MNICGIHRWRLVSSQFAKFVVLAISVFVSGCATTNFAKSDAPAAVQEQWVRGGLYKWGGPRVYAIGNHQVGYKHLDNGNTYLVDPGPTALKVWYFGNRDFGGNMRYQTDIVTMRATLAPNGRYEVRYVQVGSGAKGEMVMLQLVDRATEQTIVESRPLPVLYSPSKMPATPIVAPIYVR